MRPHVMQLIFRLAPGGAERLALTTLDKAGSMIRGSVCGLFGHTGPLVAELEQRRIPWFGLDVIGRSRLPGIMRLAALLRRQRVDVLHVQAAYLLQWAAPAAWLTGTRLVYTEHSSHTFETQPRMARLVRWMAPFLGGMSCVTERLRRYMTDRMGIAPHRVRLIRNGVDVERFSPHGPVAPLPDGWAHAAAPVSADHGDCGDRAVIGNVARFCEAKDHPGLLRAFHDVQSTHPAARLLLVGDGETRPQAEALRDALALGDTVHFAGTRQDVPALLRAMTVFVLSSRHEGMPVAVLEAMACGVPVVTTDVGGIGELVRDGETARIVPPGDPQALADALRWMLDHPAERMAMRDRALAMVRARCGHDVMVRGYLDLYGVADASSFALPRTGYATVSPASASVSASRISEPAPRTSESTPRTSESTSRTSGPTAPSPDRRNRP
ncbi:glycosyltransferase family 4 protein [Nitratidesulfovibrio vulgaris]|uniref:Glycosyl transferase, group 1 n=1 Tax=Nitratidesulfovibrio vulgaris (strain DP4) TaxID=391774 RepID=A0A0H3ACM4_NITV4|nr:glycosyltransferase [Nitratidesulfovibrio vulgaris]ABM30066.1 glycosyl transferase, group 1 [Nitratidesulfovibrio vulgaris DP4]